jgi:hypothetical protein
MFGTWISKVDTLHLEFESAHPYKHCCIDNFLNIDIFEKLLSAFPNLDDTGFYHYDNPIECKLLMQAGSNFLNHPLYLSLTETLQSNEFIDILRKITGIHNLEKDEYLHGCGIHYQPKNSKLDLHLDYSIHPKSGKERRINLVIYLNKEWKEEWDGALELWKPDESGNKPGECAKRVFPNPNTAVIFQTTDSSIHGVPNMIRCPETVGRAMFAMYYMSEPRTNIVFRSKANFFYKKDQIITEGLKQLYLIRNTRSITTEDLETFFPDWRRHPSGKGFWYN